MTVTFAAPNGAPLPSRVASRVFTATEPLAFISARFPESDARPEEMVYRDGAFGPLYARSTQVGDLFTVVRSSGWPEGVEICVQESGAATVSAFYPLALETIRVRSESTLSPTNNVSDVRMFHTSNGGDIEFSGGAAVLSDGLETFCYLALFGGNEQDPGLRGDTRLQWWGNIGEPIVARHYRSETQHLVRSLPAVIANLRRIEDAAKRDLSALIDTQIAASITAAASMPARNVLDLAIKVEVLEGETYRFDYREPWGTRSS